MFSKLYINLALISVSVSIIYSCSTTKYVSDGEYLLNKNTVEISDRRAVNKEDIEPYIKQRTNRQGLFNIKFKLLQYNLSGKDTSKWLNRKLRSWGEAPIIIDTSTVEYSKNNIATFMRSRGHYHSTVDDSIIYGKKQAEVVYKINPGLPFRFNKINYEINDTAIRNIVIADTANSLLKSNRRLSSGLLDRERERLTSSLRNKGYYAFNKGYVTFKADTTTNNNTANIVLSIDDYQTIDDDGNKITTAHPVYGINNVFISTEHIVPRTRARIEQEAKYDTLHGKGIRLLYKDFPKLKPGVLSRLNMIAENDIYSDENVNITYTNLSNLRLFKTITVKFDNAGNDPVTGRNLLDCIIQADPNLNQSYKTDFEISTNSSGLIGFSPGVHYGHRNLLGGAESLSADFRGVFQYGSSSTLGKSMNSREFNIVATLNVPRFLMPVSIPYFKIYVPETQIYTAYTFQKRPDYTRAMAGLRLGYIWKTSHNRTFMLNPVDFSMVKMYNLDANFYQSLSNPYLRNSYADHFTLGLTGSIIYNSQTNVPSVSGRRRSSFFYIRFNGDIAGNLLSAFNRLMKTNSAGHKMIFDMPYSQYAKADINFVYNKPVTRRNPTGRRDFSRRNAAVYRIYFGIGKGYGNFNAMPFEKMFFSGGANSLRGWQVRSLGPGSFSADSVSVIPNQVGDMQLELNFEYRFSMFWKFEGAWFVDAGNIWNITSQDTREGVLFKFNRFYKEVALDTGVGLRLNFGYFVLRLDLGCKVYNPGLAENKFIPPDKWLKSENFGLHFGINYPF